MKREVLVIQDPHKTLQINFRVLKFKNKSERLNVLTRVTEKIVFTVVSIISISYANIKARLENE